MSNKNNSNLTFTRELGLFTCTMIVAGLVIGSGVFKKIIPMAQTNIGEIPILIAWAIAGLITLFGALSVGGLSSLTEESGGTYEYFRLSFGKFFAFISGWSDFMIVGTGVNAALAFFFAQTINSFVTLPNPFESLANISFANFIFPFQYSGIKLVAIITIVFLTAINCIGTRESGVFNNLITSAKIIGILIVISFGLTHSGPHTNVLPEAIKNVPTPTGFSFLSGFFTAMLAALWAYDGWIYVTNITGEVKNPKRNIPLALTLGILITISIYLILNFVFMRIVPVDVLRTIPENEIGALVVANALLGSYGSTILSILILVCVFGALNSNIVSIPRKYYQMAHEGYFFSKVKEIHPRFRTPIKALIYSMVWSSILVLSGSFDMLTDMVVFTAFVFYGSLCVALIKMKRNGVIKVNVAGYPFAPIIFLTFSSIFLIHTLFTEPNKSLFGLILILSSIPFYFYFKHTHKRDSINTMTTILPK